VYFWRDSNSNEVDVIVENGAGLMPIEIKSGKTVVRDSFAGLDKWRSLAGNSAMEPILIYGGEEEYQQYGVRVIGWKKFDQAITQD
jgi:predicted AAA+ superfamily ATPase